MEKLLLMGADSSAKTAIEYCKELGVHTIVTDYLPPEQSKGKMLADEYWMIDLNDLDALEKKCREEGVTSVYAGINEYCIDHTQALAKRLGLPFYASDEGWACARDKARFKEHCIAVGLDVPKRYDIKPPFTAEKLAELDYPVIVKPVDSSASRGVTICRKAEEVEPAYNYAMTLSPRGIIIIEEYVEGFETAPAHFVVDGKTYFTSMDDIIYGERTNGNNMSYTFTPSPLQEEYLRQCGDKVQALCTRLGCKHGNFYFEVIYAKGKFYFLELIHRVDGVGIWSLTDKIQGFNVIKRMVSYALGRPDPEPREVSGKYKCGGIYFYWAKPGKIARIAGRDEVAAMDGVEYIVERFHEGDVIAESNDMRQMAYYISVVAADGAEFADKLRKITSTLKLYDENGNELTDPVLPLEKYGLK